MSKRLFEKLILSLGLVLSLWAVVFGVRAQLGNMISEGVVPGDPQTESLALTAESLSPSDPKAIWLAASTRNSGVDAKSARIVAEELKLSIELSPYDFKWWIERGRVLEKAGRLAEAESHLLRAVALAPNYSAPRWYLGNFYLRSGNKEKSIEHFAIAAKGETGYREEVFAIIDDFFESPSQYLAKIVGRDAEMTVTLSRYLAVRGKFVESLSAWNRLSSEDKNRLEIFAIAIAQSLYDRRSYKAASSVLKDLGREDADPGKVLNGGFENNFLNPKDVFFGWRISSRNRVDVRADGRNKKEGKRSLRISFDGTEQEFVGNALQIVVAEPGKKYRIAFWVRGESVRTAGSPRVDILSLSDGRNFGSSEPLKGTFDWQRKSIEFTVPEGEEGFLLAINREPCGPQCPIYGVLWFDEFLLEEIN